MGPDIEPLSSIDEELVAQLVTVGGDGQKLLGFTRRDSDGGRFATVWHMELNMPLYPMGRFYVMGSPGGIPVDPGDGRIVYLSSYRYLGKTALRKQEVARTYLWAWLVCPVVVVLLPLWLLIELFQVVSGWDLLPEVSLVLFIAWLAALAGLPILARLGLTRAQRAWWGDDDWLG